MTVLMFRAFLFKERGEDKEERKKNLKIKIGRRYIQKQQQKDQ